MAATVMTHLDGVRAKVEQERGTQMVACISTFVEGTSGFQTWMEATGGMFSRRPSAGAGRHRSIRTQHSKVLGEKEAEHRSSVNTPTTRAPTILLDNPTVEFAANDTRGQPHP